MPHAQTRRERATASQYGGYWRAARLSSASGMGSVEGFSAMSMGGMNPIRADSQGAR
jgi:hypothetical protein